MDLLYFIKVLFRRKWIIIGTTLLAMIAAFVFVSNGKYFYESKAQYSTGFTLDRVSLSQAGSTADIYAANTKFNNVIETFKSPRVIGMISYKLLLHDLENPATAWRKLSAKQKEGGTYKGVNKDSAISLLTEKIKDNQMLRSEIKSERDLLEYLKLYEYDYYSILANLFISRVQATDYLNIVYRSQNPYLSAWVVNAMGTEFINYYKTLSFQRSEENVSTIRDLVRQEQEKIDTLNEAMFAERVRQGAIDPAVLSASSLQTVQELEGKLADENKNYEIQKNTLAYLQATQKQEQERTAGGAGSTSKYSDLNKQKIKLESELVAKGGSDPEIEMKLARVRLELLKVRPTVGDNISLNDKAADLQRQINHARALMNASEATIRDYNGKIRHYQRLTNLNPGSAVKISIIKDQLDMEQKQLAGLKDKLSQAEGLSKDIPTSNFTQTLIGQPAVEPQPRKLLTKMGISGMSVFFLISFAFLFVEIFNTSIKTPFGFTKAVKLPLINVLNNVRLKNRTATDVILQEATAKKNNDAVFKNNIRKLRFELDQTGQKSFLLTSTKKSSGKSTVIEALAASFLLTQKKVLLIDFNLHHNTLTQKYNAGVSIQEIEEKYQKNLPVISQNIASNTDWEHLDIIGCQEGNETPSEVLRNFNLGEFMNKLKEKYDIILMEGAALNKYSDSKELMQYVDKVITVFTAEEEVAQADKNSIAYIRSLKEKNMGAILNNVLPENINY